MFLEIPLGFGRDLYDFDFSMQGGEEFLSFDSSVLRPAATVPDLSGGSNAVTIGSRGSGRVVQGSGRLDGDDLGAERLEAVRRATCR